jgi:toxin ParE1/3/4
VKVVLTRRALADLENIADWIGQDNPDRAVTFIVALREKCHELSAFPEAWPLKQGSNPMQARIRNWHGYLIVYVILKSRIDILHIVNAARDVDALMGV